MTFTSSPGNPHEQTQETTPLKINSTTQSETPLPFHAKTSLFFSIFNLMNDITSPSTVNLPQFFTQAGPYLTIILLCAFGVITFHSLSVLFHLSKRYKKYNYPDLIQLAFGKFGYTLACFFMFMYNFGSLLSAFLMFGGVVPELLLYVLDQEYFFSSRTMVLIYITLILLPVVFKKELGEFAIFSFICFSSVISISILLLILVIRGTHYEPSPPDPFRFANSRALSALGGLSFIFMCHDLSFNVFGSLDNPTPRRYYIVVGAAMMLVISICVMMGFSGYLLFFDLNLRDGNVLNLLPRSTAVGIISRLLLMLNLALSIPYQIFMPRVAITLLFKAAIPSLFRNSSHRNIFHYSTTLFIIGLSLIISIFVTDIGIVAAITGSIAASTLAYIVPGLLVLRLHTGFSLNKVASLFVVLIGSGIFVCSMASIVYFLVYPN